jgi:hypothetical protein
MVPAFAGTTRELIARPLSNPFPSRCDKGCRWRRGKGPAAAKKDEDDSDAEADEMMKKMLKQGREFLDRQKRK